MTSPPETDPDRDKEPGSGERWLETRVQRLEEENSRLLAAINRQEAEIRQSIILTVGRFFRDRLYNRLPPNPKMDAAWSRVSREIREPFTGEEEKHGVTGGKEDIGCTNRDVVAENEHLYISGIFADYGRVSREYVPDNNPGLVLEPGDIKMVAFYLPQYHPIAENDRWWGRGFTDWANVARAVPQFAGHYQPHQPDELGFYDLRVFEVQKRQIELARQYGIYGFCFHYYWFNGRRLLESPLNQFLAHRELDFPFCICWANENWTRRWDGLEHEVLLAQTHSPENDVKFISDLQPLLKDQRYIKISGKPVILVYRVSLLPDPGSTAERWRAFCRENGIGEIYLVAAQTFGFKDPRSVGYDAAVEFPPHSMPGCRNITDSYHPVNPEFSGKIWDYAGFIQTRRYLSRVSYPLFKAICPGWDNSARRVNNPSIYHGSSPELYKKWLKEIINYTREVNSADKQFIFINAWNEWAEGAHLEPDKKFGFGYLRSTAEAIREARRKESTGNQ